MSAEGRRDALTILGAAAALGTGALTALLARLGAPLWADIATAAAGVFCAGYLTGRRDELGFIIRIAGRKK